MFKVGRGLLHQKRLVDQVEKRERKDTKEFIEQPQLLPRHPGRGVQAVYHQQALRDHQHLYVIT